MSTADNPFAAPGDAVKRDQWKRPLVVPPGGGKAVGHHRPSSLGKVLTDTSALKRWHAAQVAKGLAARPDLVLAVQTNAADDKRRLYRLCDDAAEAAQSSASATVGTAVHALTCAVDLGAPLPAGLAPEAHADLDAWRRATQGVLTHEHLEPFLVCDELTAAGSADRLSRLADPSGCCDRLHVVDLKTGANAVKYGGVEIPVQLAVYAHSVLFDVESGVRTPVDLCHRRGVVVHLPAGSGEAALHWVDLEVGWELAHLAISVKGARKAKGAISHDGPRAPGADDPRPIRDQIADCRTVEALEALWRDTGTRWLTADVDRAKAHRVWLDGQAAGAA